MILNLFLFIIACIILVISGSWLVKLLSKIAGYLHLGDFAVASMIMAFSTSIPELFVGINSAISKTPLLSLGNVIGANIANLTMVIAIAALLGKGIKIKETNTKEQGNLMFIFATLPLILMGLGNEISRLDGFILILAFLYYVYTLSKIKIPEKKEIKNGGLMGFFNFLNTFFLFIFVIGILFLSSYFVVKYAELLSIDLEIPELLIGLFLISFGTTMPELVFGVNAAIRKKGEMALGDSIGSVICNSTLILGIVALIYPIKDSFTLFITSALYLIFTIVVFIYLIKNKEISWKKALILLFMYILFVALEFNIKG